MLNYFLLSLSFIASFTSFTLSDAVYEDLYIVPTYSEDNELTLTLLPEVKMKSSPRKLDADWGPSLQSSSAVIMDKASGKILWQKNADNVTSIASITKLMTALVALDKIENWEETYDMKANENALIGARVHVENGDELTKQDLLKTALVGSANNAALALAHSTGLSDEEFALAMNDKADQLGLANTDFVEPTGLEAGNKSTAKDIAVMTRTAMHYDAIKNPLGQGTHQMMKQRNGEDVAEVSVKTTNRLIKNAEPLIIGGKTGFTYEAGYCLTTLSANEAGNELIVVVLGGPDATVRFEETQQLVQWTYQHYTWE